METPPDTPPRHEIDPGVLEHTRAVAARAKERVELLDKRPPTDSLPERTERIAEEVGALIGMVGHLHSAICAIERRLSSQPPPEPPPAP